VFNVESKQEFNFLHFHIGKVFRLPLKVYKLENQGCSGFASSTLQEEISTAHGTTWIKFHAFINSQLLLINSNILLQAMILKRVGSFVPFWLPQFCTFFPHRWAISLAKHSPKTLSDVPKNLTAV